MSDNSKKLVTAFVDALKIEKVAVVDSLEYNSIKEWDSVAHMVLIATLEQSFDIMLDVDDIVEMSSVAKAREILASQGISFE